MTRAESVGFGAAATLWGLAGTLSTPALRLLLRRRLRAGKEIAGRLGERRGLDATRRPDGRLVWLHAASVGETLSLLPLIGALRRRDPALHVLLTTGTATAQRLAADRLAADRSAGAMAGGAVAVRFAPLDVPGWIGRFLDHWRPELAVLVESELWPASIAACRRRGIGLALVNARLSDRSAARWKRSGPVGRGLFAAFSLVSARSVQDAARLRALGVAGVEHDGDLKRAAPPLPFDAAELDRLRMLIGDRPCWLAASTHPGEETALLAMHGALLPRHPRLLLILAPRHPERGDAVAALWPGLPRRSRRQDPAPADAAWLCDTLGELGLFYRLCDIVLLGNSLDAVDGRAGGHNPLEPARLGCALATGPRMENFREDARALAEAGGLAMLPDQAALRSWLDGMLSEDGRRRAMADAALSVCGRDDGLPDRLADRLLSMVRSDSR